MRNADYVPAVAPPLQDVESTRRYLQQELDRLAQKDDTLAMTVLTKEPSRLFEGLTVYADGTVWNPGEGAGLYVYSEGRWKKTTGRRYLSVDTTLYFRTDGNDATGDGSANSAAKAFATPQGAYNYLTSRLDLGGKTVSITRGLAGTYPGIRVDQPWTGGGKVWFIGDLTTALGSDADTTISGGAIDAFVNTCPLPGQVYFDGFNLASNFNGLNVSAPGTVDFQRLRFGLCGNIHLQAAYPGAKLNAIGPYRIKNTASSFHWTAANYGHISIVNQRITVDAGANFNTFAFIYNGTVNAQYNLPTGSLFSQNGGTGRKFFVSHNGIIDTLGASRQLFPGATNDAVEVNGGRYL